MKTWLIESPVTTATGIQQWKVQAEDKETAIQLYNRGEATFVCEEIEVTGLGEPTVTESDED